MKKTKKISKRKKMRSGYEERVAQNLASRKVDYSYEEHSLPYTRPARTCWYTPDFKLKNSGVFVETKGRFTSKDRTKLLRVRDENPGSVVYLLFQRDNKLNKTSKTRYSDWCTKNGFTYAIGDKVPKEWLK